VVKVSLLARLRPGWLLIGILVAVVVAGLAVTGVIAQRASTDLAIEVHGDSAPWATERESRLTRVTVYGTTADSVRLSVQHDGREVLSFPDVQPGQSVEFRIFKEFASGSWAVQATAGDAVATAEVPVAIRWAPMVGAPPTFEPCHVVRWYVAPMGPLAGGVPISGDIRAALDEIGTATGLTFTEVSDESSADLVYSWTTEETEWKAAVAGMRTLTEGRRQGFVKLNAASEWIARPGFEFSGGKPGRGVLLLHETGHAIGLGHVNDISQIMNPTPVGEGATHLGDGDRAGLARLYEPESCSP
jgi:hypothetical protein